MHNILEETETLKNKCENYHGKRFVFKNKKITLGLIITQKSQPRKHVTTFFSFFFFEMNRVSTFPQEGVLEDVQNNKRIVYIW